MKWGNKNIKSLQYGNKSIIVAYWGNKKVWERVNEPEYDINTILESIIQGKDLDNMNKLLSNIQSSNQDFTDINNQLEEIIITDYRKPISFTVNNIEYSALENMTWEEWIYSEYSKDEFYIDQNSIKYVTITDTVSVYQLYDDVTAVDINSLIKPQSYKIENAEITYDLNNLLENIISGTNEPLNSSILNQLENSSYGFTSINKQLMYTINE